MNKKMIKNVEKRRAKYVRRKLLQDPAYRAAIHRYDDEVTAEHIKALKDLVKDENISEFKRKKL